MANHIKLEEDDRPFVYYVFRISTCYNDIAHTSLRKNNWMFIREMSSLYMDQVLWLVKAPGLLTESEIAKHLKMFSTQWLTHWYIYNDIKN